MYEIYVNGKRVRLVEEDETEHTVDLEEDNEDLWFEELISARITNFERLKDLGVKVKWKGYNYIVED